MSASTFFDAIALELLELETDRGSGRLEIREELKGPLQFLPAAALAAAAELLVMRCIESNGRQRRVYTKRVETHLLVEEPPDAGRVFATAALTHEGRSSQTWTVDFAQADGRPWASSRLLVSIRGR